MPISLLLAVVGAGYILAVVSGCGSYPVVETYTPSPSPASHSSPPRVAPSPSASVAPSPSSPLAPSPSPRAGLTRDEAIALARQVPAALDRDAPLLSARVERWGDYHGFSLVSPSPQPSTLVWVINLGEQPSPTGGHGWEILLDYETGQFLWISEWVS